MNFYKFIFPKILSETKKSSNSSKFYIGPFNKNISETLGFIIRKFLFSHTEGFAIEEIKFIDVISEFSYKSGIVEDFYDIILNFKSVILKLLNTDSLILKVSKKGPCVFYAKDLISNSCKIFNPEKKLFVLNRDCNFSFEVKIGNGFGYSYSNKENYQTEDGKILIDPYYCPIKKIYYKVLKKKFYDVLEMNIETNGSIKPFVSLKKIFKFIKFQFSFEKEICNSCSFEKIKENSIFFKKIEDFDFKEEVNIKLKKKGIFYIGDIFRIKKLNEDFFSSSDLKYLNRKFLSLGICFNET